MTNGGLNTASYTQAYCELLASREPDTPARQLFAMCCTICDSVAQHNVFINARHISTIYLCTFASRELLTHHVQLFIYILVAKIVQRLGSLPSITIRSHMYCVIKV